MVTGLHILLDWVGCSNGMIWVSSDSIFSCDFRSDGHMTLYIAGLGRLLKWDDMGIIRQHLWAHFYVSMKACTSWGPQRGPHKISNICTSPLQIICSWTVVPLWSNGNQSGCCSCGGPFPNVDAVAGCG